MLVGFALFLGLIIARELLKSGAIGPLPDSSGFRVLRLALDRGFILGLVVVAVAGYMQYRDLRDGTTPTVTEATAPREVDFGFVELDPGQPVAVPSYKNGGQMVLYAGEEFEFHALADGPIPPIELRAGDQVQLLPGPDGRVKIIGPLSQPLKAVLLAQGPARMSLPGGPPPRISMKVQVFGITRPK